MDDNKEIIKAIFRTSRKFSLEEHGNHNSICSKQTTLKTPKNYIEYNGIVARKILHYPLDQPDTCRKDSGGIEITHDRKLQRVSFRDDIKQQPVYDIYEIEKRTKRKSVCQTCIII